MRKKIRKIRKIREIKKINKINIKKIILAITLVREKSTHMLTTSSTSSKPTKRRPRLLPLVPE